MNTPKTNLELLKMIFGEGLPFNPEIEKKMERATEKFNVRIAQRLNLPYPEVLHRAKQEGGIIEMLREACEKEMLHQDLCRMLGIR